MLCLYILVRKGLLGKSANNLSLKQNGSTFFTQAAHNFDCIYYVKCFETVNSSVTYNFVNNFLCNYQQYCILYFKISKMFMEFLVKSNCWMLKGKFLPCEWLSDLLLSPHKGICQSFLVEYIKIVNLERCENILHHQPWSIRCVMVQFYIAYMCRGSKALIRCQNP